MGTSGCVLKKRKDVEFLKIIHDVEVSADRAGLMSCMDDEITVDYVEGKKRKCVTGNIANTFEEIPGAQQWFMYIFDEGYDKYDWVLEGAHLIHVILFDRIRGCEEILLDFLYEYLKRNPEDYFWSEEKWCYTYEDIIRIKKKEFDPLWCYKNPHLDTEDI